MVRANLDAVTGAVDGLLDAALDFRQMPGAIEQVRHLFDGSKICLGYFGPDSHPDNAITNASDPDLNAFLHRELMADAKFIEGGTSIHYLEAWVSEHKR